ncbi:hypothetical protein B6A14_05055 [Polynucleobacter hirudinilacicola]|uniref:Uncharacterized protein n=1 Tax=Polynucleobacter hirudinilacicola TaxID=1743166 RepID=A0A210RW00_9BURK|nr:hypothetical protein [Polynucleobacter hirudinilacicola]OWF65183.1 hypothetical protein B6A14_05055 [Polynucleobacter hirudinilacicola]
MYKTIGILTTFFTLLFYGMTGMAQNQTAVVKVSYAWLPGKLIPNEFALVDGTWSNSSIRECVSKCSAQRTCSGFSIKKIYGDAWQSGCKDGTCDQKTECHAKGPQGSVEYWLPNDQQIRVPKVDAGSNAWIQMWGTILKNSH